MMMSLGVYTWAVMIFSCTLRSSVNANERAPAVLFQIKYLQTERFYELGSTHTGSSCAHGVHGNSVANTERADAFVMAVSLWRRYAFEGNLTEKDR